MKLSGFVVAALAAFALIVLGVGPLAAALALTALHPSQPPIARRASSVDVASVLGWANRHVGDRYRMGADGPDAWDCSSFTRAAYAQVGVHLPRLAQDQRDWLATGHGTRIPPAREQPGDLIFWDSYLGPITIGHVVLVDNPTTHRTVEAHNTRGGVGHFSYHSHHHRYEVWRPHLPHHPTVTEAGR